MSAPDFVPVGDTADLTFIRASHGGISLVVHFSIGTYKLGLTESDYVALMFGQSQVPCEVQRCLPPRAEVVGLNGLTDEQTAATASVVGLKHPTVPPEGIPIPTRPDTPETRAEDMQAEMELAAELAADAPCALAAKQNLSPEEQASGWSRIPLEERTQWRGFFKPEDPDTRDSLSYWPTFIEFYTFEGHHRILPGHAVLHYGNPARVDVWRPLHISGQSYYNWHLATTRWRGEPYACLEYVDTQGMIKRTFASTLRGTSHLLWRLAKQP